MVFDHDEAKGKIVLEQGSYGAFLWINGKCLAIGGFGIVTFLIGLKHGR